MSKYKRTMTDDEVIAAWIAMPREERSGIAFMTAPWTELEQQIKKYYKSLTKLEKAIYNIENYQGEE